MDEAKRWRYFSHESRHLWGQDTTKSEFEANPALYEALKLGCLQRIASSLEGIHGLLQCHKLPRNLDLLEAYLKSNTPKPRRKKNARKRK